MKNNKCFTTVLVLILSVWSINAQVTVNSLSGLNNAMKLSNQEIILEAGNYELEDLPSSSRKIICSGSNNEIDLTGVRIKSRVGSVSEVYFMVSGDNNVFTNGAIEDYYQSGLEEVTDFSAYNNDRSNLAKGLGGDPIMEITGDGNLLEGLEMTVKGSFPYGYGSQYGIGSGDTFGKSKRCGILITGRDGGGVGNTLDRITMYHHAFGHGIFMQTGATETTIKNCYVEGRVRLSDDMYNDTETYDLPYRTDYKFPSGDDWRTLPFAESYDIPRGENSVVYPLSEDGIRSYNSTGSVVVENCTVKQMRGGIRLYLASSATVINSTAIDCGSGGTNYNMPSGGTISGSSGNFSYTSLNDNRLSRSNQDIEMTIIPSPHAIGPHNIADILGNNQDIVFHRTPGPLDSDEERAIVVSGDNSTIVNETEYRIILESGASGNTIITCGPVTDNGSGNTVTLRTDCDFDIIATDCSPILIDRQIDSEDFCENEGATVNDATEGGFYMGGIQAGDYLSYGVFDFDVNSIDAIEVAVGKSSTKDTYIEVRLDDPTGTLIGTVDVSETTGGSQVWATEWVNLDPTSGKHEVFLVFAGEVNVTLVNFNWFKLFEADICFLTAEDRPEHIEAECLDEISGALVEAPDGNGISDIGSIQDGYWVKYNDIDLTSMKSVSITASSDREGGSVELRLNAIDGQLIGEVGIPNTGGWNEWVSFTSNIDPVDGENDLYLVFTGGDSWLYNIDYFGFSEEQVVVTSVNDVLNLDPFIFPNPASDFLNVNHQSGAIARVFNMTGNLELNQIILSDHQLINIEELPKGMYYIVVSNENRTGKKLFIKN